MKKFAIYCSGTASRVISFYNDRVNAIKYSPSLVVYDGQNSSTTSKLKTIFGEKLIQLRLENLSLIETERIHQTTSDYILKNLLRYTCEYLVCFGDKILKPNLIDKFQKKLINFHPSLLPAYPGLNSIDQAINGKAILLGNTVHYIDKGIDSGEIIAQSAMLSEDFRCYEDVLELQFPLFKLILRDILCYKVADIEIVSDIKGRNKKYLIPSRCNQS